MQILLWGTYDTGKPRIRILRDGLNETPGIRIREIHAPIWEGIEDKTQIHGFTRHLRLLARWLLSYPSLVWRLLRTPKPNLLLVSYPGVVDMLVALPIARARRIPIAWDVFISLYDTICLDRRLLHADGVPGRLLRWVEGLALRAADIAFMDTQAHARHVENLFGLEPGHCGSVWVGVETEHFQRVAPIEAPPVGTPMRVLFYGQFIPLHGIDIIVRAARLLKHHPIEWQLVGRGQVMGDIRRLLDEEPLPKLRWLEWVEYEQLQKFIAEADLCLGIFGTSAKAANVIPNKVFQIIAAERPLVTMDSPAIRELLADMPPQVHLVPPGDPDALAGAVLHHLRHRGDTGSREDHVPPEIGKAAVARQFLALMDGSLRS
ncbi:glycosyltransferase [Luteimonas sp. Y-2-2-4F]|nr:glycosyltransferase [Luteimonas sp. Y-2-2-4F]MCD9031661.1 glycosyltransferase [Luteimonas sp. Y-2-2-4F]